MSEAQNDEVPSAAEELLAELKRVRRGRGLAGAAENRTIGPRLGNLCKIDDGDSAERVLAKLTHRVSTLLSGLSEQDSIAVAAALGIGSEFGRDDVLGQRINSLSAKLHVDDRTARRRIDVALARFADFATDSAKPISLDDSARRGWHARSVRAVVLIGRGGVEVLELRTVVSETLELRRIYLGFSTPSPDGGATSPQSRLEIDALYGGDIVERKIETSARTGFALEFPRPLKIGEAYEYGVRFRLPSGAEFLPYYVLVPWVVCEEFDLRVKFETIPAKVELLSGVLQADTHDSVLDAPAIEIDTLGEVRAKFKQLQPGMAYGVRWLDE
jgi:hypothetical protein